MCLFVCSAVASDWNRCPSVLLVTGPYLTLVSFHSIIDENLDREMFNDGLQFFNSKNGHRAFNDVYEHLSSISNASIPPVCCLGAGGRLSNCCCMADINDMNASGLATSYNSKIHNLLSLACTTLVIFRECSGHLDHSALRRLSFLVRTGENDDGSTTVYIDLDPFYLAEARRSLFNAKDGMIVMPHQNMARNKTTGRYSPSKGGMICATSAVLFLHTIFHYEFAVVSETTGPEESNEKRLCSLVDWTELLSSILKIGLSFFPDLTKCEAQNAYRAHVYQAYLHRPSTKDVEYYPFGESKETSKFAQILGIDVQQPREYVRQSIDRYRQLLEKHNLPSAICVLQPITIHKRKDDEVAVGVYEEYPGLDAKALANKDRIFVRVFKAIENCTPDVRNDVWRDINLGGMPGVFLWELKGDNLFELLQEVDRDFGVKKEMGMLGIADTSEKALRHLSNEFTWIIDEMVANLRRRITGRHRPQGTDLTSKRFSLLCLGSHVPQPVTFDTINEDKRKTMFTIVIPLSADGVFFEVFPVQSGNSSKQQGTLFHLPQQFAAVIWGNYAVAVGLKAKVFGSNDFAGSHLRMIVRVSIDSSTKLLEKPFSHVHAGGKYEHSSALEKLNETFFDAESYVVNLAAWLNDVTGSIQTKTSGKKKPAASTSTDSETSSGRSNPKSNALRERTKRKRDADAKNALVTCWNDFGTRDVQFLDTQITDVYLPRTMDDAATS